MQTFHLSLTKMEKSISPEMPPVQLKQLGQALATKPNRCGTLSVK